MIEIVVNICQCILINRNLALMMHYCFFDFSSLYKLRHKYNLILLLAFFQHWRIYSQIRRVYYHGNIILLWQRRQVNIIVHYHLSLLLIVSLFLHSLDKQFVYRAYLLRIVFNKLKFYLKNKIKNNLKINSYFHSINYKPWIKVTNSTKTFEEQIILKAKRSKFTNFTRINSRLRFNLRKTLKTCSST